MAELNHYGDTILGVVTQEDVVEGRFVLLTTNVHSRDYGSMEDLPGVKLPDTRAEAARAKYILFFEQDDSPIPIYRPMPHYDWAMRDGWEQTSNVPFAATVLLTHPGAQIAQTIPSGMGAAAFGEGIYTLTSGNYVYSATLETPGTQVEVANNADHSAGDSGKPVVLSAGVAMGEVVRFYSEDSRLTIRVY